MVPGAKEWEGYLADFAPLASNGTRPAPPWMRELRRTALDRFTALGFPTTKHEEWKYTNVAPIARSRFERAESTRNGLTASAWRSSPSVSRGARGSCSSTAGTPRRFRPYRICQMG